MHLANLLRGNYLLVCHVPSREIVQYRELTRSRQKCVRFRTLMKNSIHGILLQNNIKTKASRFTITHKTELRQLNEYRINLYLDQMAVLDDSIHRLDVMVKDAVEAVPDIQRIKTVPGIGNYIALVMYSEIDGVARFKKSEQLCAYAGLVPTTRSSGDTVHLGRITKKGSRLLRWVAVEAVGIHIMHTPDSNLTKFYKRLAKKKGHSKAKVAAASKLLRIVYQMLKDQKDYVQNV